ncbi:YggT family protein [Corynebacterium sp. MSK044]|uniref:YggT family protein n=1 Tax=unclassified Corynebacterium TaxID=2624378 RepID=UPI00254BAD34|nr:MULTISPECIES: YggT family protein [unclassified Corynebacterium]MDK8794342.1 YggT family protein [Corynebacterium sp. MSK041]MDK8796359.1 YggT family protein [Corynebacterium sp. MSK044]
MIGAILYALIGLYTFMVIVRLIIEMIQSFSKHFSPPRWFMVIAEFFFVTTDPPLRLLRRFIPPLPLGGVALDVSVIVLFIALMLLSAVVRLSFGI